MYTTDTIHDDPGSPILQMVAETTVSQAEAAELLGISLACLRSRVHRGRVPSIRIGRAVRIPRSAITEKITEMVAT